MAQGEGRGTRRGGARSGEGGSLKRFLLLAALALAACGERAPVASDSASVSQIEGVRLAGLNAVGWTRATVGGAPLLLFYPAAGPGDSPPTQPPSAALARRFGEAAAADLAAATFPAAYRAPPAGKGLPLILFLPGAGLGSSDYRWLLADLASRGALVAALDPDSSPAAGEGRVAEARDEMAAAARALASAPGLRLYGAGDRLLLLGHSIGGAAAVAALSAIPGAKAAANIDGDFLGASKAPVEGPVLLVSGTNPKEPESAAVRRTADWNVVAHGTGQRLLLANFRHLGATDAALVPDARRTADLGPDPLGQHRAVADAVAAFLLER